MTETQDEFQERMLKKTLKIGHFLFDNDINSSKDLFETYYAALSCIYAHSVASGFSGIDFLIDNIKKETHKTKEHMDKATLQ